MGKGIDLARGLDLSTGGTGLHAKALDDFKDQLLIVLLKRLKSVGQKLDFPITEVDDTGQDMASFCVANGAFHFELSKKS